MDRAPEALSPESELPPSPTRQALLIALLRGGPLAPEALARRLELSRTAVLHQLRLLAEAGLVERHSVRHGVGRPRHLYDVTPRAHGMTAGHYELVLGSIFAAITATGGSELLDRVLDAAGSDQRRDIAAELARRIPLRADTPARADALVELLGERGYVWDVRHGDELRLLAYTCPFYRMVGAAPEVCGLEVALVRDALGVSVERETSIADGDRCCTYLVTPGSRS
jgi:predicted ArsR family transcriptional regulator